MTNLLIETALKGSLLLAAAWIAAVCLSNQNRALRALRHSSAALRHLIWLSALASLIVLALPWPVPEGQLTIAVNATFVAAASRTEQLISSRLWIVWLAGFMLLISKIALSFVRLAQLTRRAKPVAGNIRVSESIPTPLTWGLFRPVILLPPSLVESDSAIRHEQAHIARRDWLWQTFATGMTAVFWFHPLVWLAAARLRQEAEQAADDCVLAQGADPSAYAGQLLAIARRMHAGAPVAAVAMLRPSGLKSRIQAILDPGRSRHPLGALARSAVIASALAMTAACAGLHEARVYRVKDKGITAPKLTSKVEPQYTQQARDDKRQGSVVLSIVVDEQGQAQNVRVTRALGDGLDESAVSAVRQWSFEPGKKNGKPVRVAAVVEVNFRLL